MSILEETKTITITREEQQLIMAGLILLRRTAAHNLDYKTQLQADNLHTIISKP